MYRDGDADPHDRRRRHRRKRIDHDPTEPIEPSAWTGPGRSVTGSMGADADNIYQPDFSPDAAADGLQRALYNTENGMLPLFSGARDERARGPPARRDDDLPGDLDSLVDGMDLGLGLADLEDLPR